MPSLNFHRQLQWLTTLVLIGIGLVVSSAQPVAADPVLAAVQLVNQTTVVPVPSVSSSPLVHVDLLFPDGLAQSSATVRFSLFHSTYASSVLFQQIDAAPQQGAMATTAALPIACAAAGTARASFTLGLVAIGGPTPSGLVAPGCTSRAPQLQLPCTETSCTGIYPLVITVTDGAGAVLSSVTTFVDVTAGHVNNPVRVALVAQLTPSGIAPVRTAGAVLDALGRHRDVAVTVAPVPGLVDLSTRRGGSLTQQLRSALRDGRAVLSNTYVPVNPTWLTAAGLTQELARQRDSGRTTMAKVGVAPTSALTLSFVGAASIPSAVDLHRIGAGSVIVGGSQLTEDPAASIGWGQPFTLVSETSSIRAVATDDRLTKVLTNAARNPVLVANQVLGFLAFRYREAPGLITPRGVVVAPALGTSLPPAFYDAFLRGLAITPELRPMTLPAFLGSVPVGGNGGATTRYARSVSAASDRALAGSLRAGRTTWSSFGPLLSSAPLTFARLDHQLLSAQSLALSNKVALVRATAVRAEMASLTNDVRVSTSSFTLTSQQGTLPLTIASTAPCPLVVHVDLVSDRLTFPSGQHFNVNITQAATTVRIPVNAATTGVLPMRISVTAPGTNVVLAGTSVTVQVAATSIVGKALTAGAVAVLGWWWFSTWRRSRREQAENDD